MSCLRTRESLIPFVEASLFACTDTYGDTTDLDLVIRSEDNETVRQVLIDAGFTWIPVQAEFHSADGIAIQFLIAGQKAGKGSEGLQSLSRLVN